MEDAFDYARRAVENEWDYDLIIVDLFIDDRNQVWPEDFWENLKCMMNSSGVAIINTMCDEQAFKEFGKAASTLWFYRPALECNQRKPRLGGKEIKKRLQ